MANPKNIRVAGKLNPNRRIPLRDKTVNQLFREVFFLARLEKEREFRHIK
jgi:hypothetical protein